MLQTVMELIGMTVDDYNLTGDVVFVVLALFLLYCLGYMFNFFQTLMERLTARKGGRYG